MATRNTISDVARAAGVSIKTVSRVLNKERYVREGTRAKVEAAMSALSFSPSQAARALAGHRSHQIALGGGVSISNQQLIVILVSLALMFVLRLIVLHTRVGKAMRAVSYSHTAAALMGISVDRIITFTFVLGSMLAAAAGVLVALQNPRIEPYMGIMPGLKAFVAAVLGGIGNIPGAVLGGLVMGIAEVLVVGYLSPTWRDAIAFVLLIVILLVRPAGLLGRQVAEKV